MTNGIKKFNVVQENIAATSAKINNERWMSQRPQMCWKCQKDKPLKGGALKFFGTVRRFICVDCVFAKYAVIAKETRDAK